MGLLGKEGYSSLSAPFPSLSFASSHGSVMIMIIASWTICIYILYGCVGKFLKEKSWQHLRT